MIRASAEHLLALINDVLDISKIEAGELELHMAAFDLPASMRKAAQSVAPQAEKKGLSLRVEIPTDFGAVVGDRRRVEQVLLNLLSNAVKFTERGGITLTAERWPQGVRLSVADTGVGIRPEDIGKLFQPFEQLNNSLARRHEGTGLGLAICKRLVNRWGGDIAVESVPGKGSVFWFTLPIHSPEAS